MADKMNESYYRCLDELRTRYRGRGVASNGTKQAALEEKRAEDYMLFDSQSKIADVYRSGVYNGSKYMTSDDFVRYFKHRREFNMPEALVRKQAALDETALPTKRITSRGMRESSDSKEGHLKTLISALITLKDKWICPEPREGREQRGGFRLPVAAMSGLAVFTLSLGLIVGGSVMIGSA